MRLLLVGAFSYPHHQGSQVYFQEQALALRAAGAEVELLTYGRRDESAPTDPERWRALDGFVHHTVPARARPRSDTSGPVLGKPRADLALRRVLYDAIASRYAAGASYDAILAHNIEACVISLTTRVKPAGSTPPVVYCVHTLMRYELSAYPKFLKSESLFPGQSESKNTKQRVKRVIDRLGERVDRFAARHADGWIALTQSAACVMLRDSTSPGSIIPPPLPHPRHRFFDAAPLAGRPSEPYFLYSGNLDGYQELHLLNGAARALSERGGTAARIVVASFDPEVAEPSQSWAPGIEPRLVRSEAEMQALIVGARATIVPRRAEGGFPIKLANSLAQGTPAITFHDREWALEDRAEVWRADPRRPVESLADAMDALARPGPEAHKMRVGSRAFYDSALRPERVAQETLALVEAVRAARQVGRGAR